MRAKLPRSMGRKSRAKAEIKAPAQAVAAVTSTWTERDWWVIGSLLVLTLLVFGQVAGHAFLNYDDGQFIYENEAVKSGLNATSINWALTSASIGWYPLTWISHALDVQLWGLKPAGHLMTQLLLHSANAIILFLALRRMTGAMTGSTIRSGFVAALFAIHPMHVESVAWASERKDTLSTLFAMLALYVYASPRRRPVLVAVLFAASLMSKQMYVTLPFLFLVLDWWPLRRGVRVAEKIPLLALSIIASLIAFIGQRNLKALQPVSALPVSTRLANALDGYLRYLGKLFWPSHLAVPYPMVDVPSGEVTFAAIVLIAVTASAWFLRNRAPWLLAGWLWFLGVLVPVIGIIQIGPQSIADRYTYFSYIGLFIAIVWTAGELLPSRIAIAIGAIVVLLFTAIAWKQTRYWKDSETLFTHAVEVTTPNPLAEYSIGQALQLSAPERALPHLERAVMLVQDSLRTHPKLPAPDWYAQSYVAMATAKLMKARVVAIPERALLLDGAEHDLQQALKIDPEAPHAENNLKVAAQMRRQLLPQGADVNALLTSGTVLSKEAKYDEAVAQFRKATELAPHSVEAHVYLGLGLAQARKNAEAIVAFREAERLDAARANDYVTRALQLPPQPTNLRDLIASLGRGSS
jgi:protein O-mannosyl-transferase